MTGKVVVEMILKSVIEEGGGVAFLSDSRARPLMVKSVPLAPSRGIVTFLYVPTHKYRTNHTNLYLLYSQIDSLNYQECPVN